MKNPQITGFRRVLNCAKQMCERQLALSHLLILPSTPVEQLYSHRTDMSENLRSYFIFLPNLLKHNSLC